MLKKALSDGLLTQKQYDKLPEKLLEGIVKSKKKNGGGKKKVVKEVVKVKKTRKRRKKKVKK